MPIIVSDPSMVNTPPGWGHCERALRELRSPLELGFVGAAGDLNRFRSRYRLAKSFQGVVLSSFASTTVSGYSSLFRLFLSWSAFELFLEICGLDISSAKLQLPEYGASSACIAIRDTPGHAVFLAFVLERLDTRTQAAQFEAFLAGASCNLLHVAKGVRHIFAHGDLSPHAGAESPYPATRVASVLSDHLFAVMDGHVALTLRARGFAA
jgi:hypothetical protein